MKVVFMPKGETAEVLRGSSILEAAQSIGRMIESPCGGHHTCGKCKVLVTKGNKEDYQKEEKEALTDEELARGMRLACSCKVLEDMTVMIPSSFCASQNKDRFLRRERKTSLGIVVDVGTTTVEFHVVDLKTSYIKKKCKFYNPQIAFGADVMARITYAAGSPAAEKMLRDVLIRKLEEEIREAVTGIGHTITEITRIVMVGNTTMSYILSRTPLNNLAKAPFALVYEGNTEVSAKDFGLLTSTDATVYIGPNIGGHVGSDAFSCLIATGVYKEEGCYLIVDVGTNGEILLSKDGKVYACSTAAGPAFEGAGLSCGMRAEQGAITKAAVKGDHIDVLVEGNVAPIGISGSGILDLLAAMLKLHIMDDSGYLSDDYCFAKGFEVAKDVFVKREDVRQIQLAKGAIYAGIVSLLKEAGVQKEELLKVYLAGAFGSNINIENAMIIGLLPKVPTERVIPVGNAAIKGAKLLLSEEQKKQEWEELKKRITHVELANLEGFQDCFIQSINFRSDLF